MKNHITAALCILIVLLLPLFFTTNLLWIIGVTVFIVLMILRSSLGEITAKTEWLFFTVYLLLFLAVIFLTIEK
jgi:hypothetical protein